MWELLERDLNLEEAVRRTLAEETRHLSAREAVSALPIDFLP